MKKPIKSAVIMFLDLVWENANKGFSHSWAALNGAMRSALSLSISAGFVFDTDDMKTIAGGYGFGYWCGESTEWIYADAIEVSNASAIKSYEAWKQRQPFIADNVTPSKHGTTRQRERLAVGNRFDWKGLSVRVTSFADDGSYLTACSYKDVKDGKYTREKVDKRFKITRDDIIADRAERKERDDIIAKLTAIAEKSGNSDQIIKALGVKKHKELPNVPLAKMRKVLESFAA